MLSKRVGKVVDRKKYLKAQAGRFSGENKEARRRLKSAYRFLRPYLSRDKPVLDIGTRDGWFVDYLRRKKFQDVQGIEITEDAVKYAQSQNRNVIWGDAQDLSAFEDEYYGTVLMIHSLEHCYDSKSAVEGVHRILQPGGTFFIEVPLEHSPDVTVAHFCNFTSVHEVKELLGDKFQLLKHKVVPMGRKVRHLLCAFRKR